MIANYHTHTWRCGHAGGNEREYVEQAITAGIRTTGNEICRNAILHTVIIHFFHFADITAAADNGLFTFNFSGINSQCLGYCRDLFKTGYRTICRGYLALSQSLCKVGTPCPAASAAICTGEQFQSKIDTRI